MFKPGLRNHAVLRALAILLSALAVTACSPPSPATNKDQILDDVNYYLSIGDCSDALNEITSLYNSSNTDNDVRMAMASVYGCFSGFNFFGFVNTASKASIDSPGVLFEIMADEFPSTSSADKVVESAGYGIDALMSVLNSGEVLITSDLINTTGYNEGSLLYTDRTQDSNDYLFFSSMGAMGGEENRNCSPSPCSGGKPTSTPALPWTTPGASGMSTDGCAYASALVNFADSIASIPDSSAGDSEPAATDVLAWVAWGLNSLTNIAAPIGMGESFAATIGQACVDGCEGTTPAIGTFLNLTGKWVATGCTNTAAKCGTACSILLRDRNNCTDTATSGPISCAAAGVINYVNSSTIGWQ